MKKACGWCDKVLEDGPDEPVTVGICDDCDAWVREEEGLPPAGEELEELKSQKVKEPAPELEDSEAEAQELKSEKVKEPEGGREIRHREPTIEHHDAEIRTRSNPAL